MSTQKKKNEIFFQRPRVTGKSSHFHHLCRRSTVKPVWKNAQNPGISKPYFLPLFKAKQAPKPPTPLIQPPKTPSRPFFC